MKLNSLIWKRAKKGLAAAGLFLCLLLTAVPAFAEEETAAPAAETTQEAPADTETKKEPETAKAPETVKTVPEVKTEISDNLIPVGNLTLVDDVISATDGHREFLTVVSRGGSYFYIVIDRDVQGAGNVYFLNLVDEEDLFKLTGEEAPKIKAEEETQITINTQKEEETQPEKKLTKEEEKEQKRKSLMVTVGVLAVVVTGVLIFTVKSRKKKKKQQAEFDLSDFEDDDE